MNTIAFTLAGVLVLTLLPARADTFGSGANTFTIDFVNIGNAGNADDPVRAADGSGLHFGGVLYDCRIGTFQISHGQITSATASGLASVVAGAWGASQPRL